MSSNDFVDWYKSIPLVSRYWFTGSVVLPLLGKFGILHVLTMILDYKMLFYKFQIWRPFTALLYYPLSPQTGFHYLLNLYFLYSYSTRLESGLFDGRPADFLFMLIINWLNLVVIGLIIGLPLLMDPMIISVLYIWCQVNKDMVVQFWFGTSFKAMYLPWVLAAFNMILMGGGFAELLGILVGHVYYFLTFKYPQDFGGRQFLQTPSFFYNYLPNRRGGVTGFGQAPASARRPDDNDGGGGGARHRWGRGNQLGQDG